MDWPSTNQAPRGLETAKIDQREQDPLHITLQLSTLS